MTPNIWIFSIESIQTRYTCEWYTHIPELLKQELTAFNVRQVEGVQKHTEPTPGAFLNFSDTNYWKSSQLCSFLEKFNSGETTPDDHFLFPDAWNPVVLQLKYISDLHGYNWVFHGLFHAGSWDPADFLGRSSGGKPWCIDTERAMFHAFHHNYFATEFHIELFHDYLFDADKDGKFLAGASVEHYRDQRKIVRTGWPMGYMRELLAPYNTADKEDIVIFPHRLSVEKQPEIFRDLAESMPEYKFVVCQDTRLTKDEYRALLAESKILWSASNQESLGISPAEGALLGVIPLMPKRLSYKEMYPAEYLYPSEWTVDYAAYQQHKPQIMELVRNTMSTYNTRVTRLPSLANHLEKNYFTPVNLIKVIKTYEKR